MRRHRVLPFLVSFLIIQILNGDVSAYDFTIKSCNFDQIYQFGDSLSDVGNFIREHPEGATAVFNSLPYGQTFFKNSTGRVTDGLLLIDYFVLEAGLPMLNPHLNFGADFTHGENFAVAGATVLSGDALAQRNISSWATNSSLAVQLEWMLLHLNTTCLPTRDCAKKLSNSLFFVGEIGGNDYNYAFSQGKTFEEVTTQVVPAVIQIIKDAVRTLINNGAARLVVPGQFPFGCFPIHLTLFHSNDSIDYDDLQCLRSVNSILTYHNDHLQHALQDLRKQYPHAIIIYGDMYNAFMWLYRNAAYFGFDSDLIQKTCCGKGGKYNYDPAPEMSCGAPGVTVCSDPRLYLNWDGIHMTQEAHKMLATWITGDIFPKLHCTPNAVHSSIGRKALNIECT